MDYYEGDYLQIDWDLYATAPLHQEVGYYEDVLDYLWDKYCMYYILFILIEHYSHFTLRPRATSGIEETKVFFPSVQVYSPLPTHKRHRCAWMLKVNGT
jgi:hypothetical protein